MSMQGSTTKASAEIALTIGGVATSGATALIVFLLQVYAEFDLSSLMLWFVIPAGSGICGFAAASGYYLASRLTQRPPSFQLLVNMVLIGLSTYALIQYLNYHTQRLQDGTHVSDIIPFWSYYQIRIESTSLQFRHRGVKMGGPTGELGGWGYVYEIIRIIGFLVGGLVTYLHLKEHPYCTECRRYYTKRPLLTRGTLDQMNHFLSQSGLLFPNLVEAYEVVMQRKHVDGFSLTLYSCSTCDHKEFRFALESGEDSVEVKKYPYVGPFEPPPTPQLPKKSRPRSA